MQLFFVTGNKNKLREVQDMLKGFEVIRVSLNIPEMQGTEEEIVRDKVQRAYDAVKKPVFVDDTSLHLEALRGLPGPYTVHFVNRIGTQGICKMLSGFENKNAIAVSLIAYHDGKNVHVFKGESHGVIVAQQGKSNFGFDPIFQPKGYGKTYAEMTLEEKNEISHRALAMRKFKEFLNQ